MHGCACVHAGGTYTAAYAWLQHIPCSTADTNNLRLVWLALRTNFPHFQSYTADSIDYIRYSPHDDIVLVNDVCA